MDKFHINPKTGNAGICKAEKGQCPFGRDEDHFDTRGEARKSWESLQETWEPVNWKSKIPLADNAEVVATFYINSPYVKPGADRSSAAYSAFSRKVLFSDFGSRLVLENGQVWERESGVDSWKFVDGEAESGQDFKRGQIWSGTFLDSSIARLGARLEKPRNTVPGTEGLRSSLDSRKYD